MVNVSSMYNRYPSLSNSGITEGVYVESVSDGSPADDGGMQAGDIIVEVDDKEVSDYAYLRYLLYNHSVGDTMKVRVYRDGDYIDLNITLDQKAS